MGSRQKREIYVLESLFLLLSLSVMLLHTRSIGRLIDCCGGGDRLNVVVAVGRLGGMALAFGGNVPKMHPQESQIVVSFVALSRERKLHTKRARSYVVRSYSANE
jgi:hypothetical protein